MNQENTEHMFDKWERGIGYTIIAAVPLSMSYAPVMVDSYLLPKVTFLSLLTFFWVGLIALRRSPILIHKTALDKPLWVYFGLCAISVCISFLTFIQIHELLHLFTYIILFYLFQRFWNDPKVTPVNVVVTLMIATTLISLYGILQDYGIDFAHPTGGVRDWRSKVISTLGNPNFLAGYLVIAMPAIIGFGLWKKSKLILSIFVGINILLYAACHTVTFSVGATTGLIGSLILVLLTSIFLFRTICVPIARTVVILAIIAFSVLWYTTENPLQQSWTFAVYRSHGVSPMDNRDGGAPLHLANHTSDDRRKTYHRYRLQQLPDPTHPLSGFELSTTVARP
jgi:hypothetical protein